ncbi:MAG: PQQ-binding-like beta-propeller repeat protein [Deltaproteobacteria bacterium]|nr:PQQ-binding-like beta-propeller repeat protein [Deltaproteobacteria bacterium]
MATSTCLAATGSLGTACSEAGSTGSPVVNSLQIRLEGVKEGATVTGAVPVTAVVTGNAHINGVEFWVGDKRVDTVLTTPYKSTIDTTPFADGAATIAAIAAVDATKSYKAQVSVTIDNTGPTVEMTDPVGAMAYYGGQDIPLTFKVEDTSGVLDVKVKVNGVTLPVSGPPYVATLSLAALSLTQADLPKDLQIRVDAVDKVYVGTNKVFDLKLASRLAWKFQTLGEIWAPPAFGPDGIAYFGARDGTLYAVDPLGNLVWSYKSGKEIVSTPAYDEDPKGDRIWVAAGDEMIVLDMQGKPAAASWTAANTLGTSPVLGNGVVYVGTYGNQMVALNRADNTVKWTFEAGLPIQSNPVVLLDDVVAFGSDDRYVHAVDAAGKEAWKFETGGKIWSGASTTTSGDVLIGSHDGYLYRLSRYGTKQFEFEARGQIWGAATEGPDGTIYVGSTYRRVYGLDGKLGKKWEYEVSGLAYATPAVSTTGFVFFSATDGKTYAMKTDGALSWLYDSGSEIVGSPRLSPDESLLLVGANDRNMYALRTGTMGCPAPQMVTVQGTKIMKYEASRADATAQSEGAFSGKACSRAGVKPWTKVSFSEAQAACKAIGLDLCPGDVWEAACQGASSADFPYGTTYNPTSCNGNEHPVGGCGNGLCTSMATGANAQCVSASGVFDASGNVREWTLDSNGTSRVVRGGGFRETGDDLRCSNASGATHTLLPDVKIDDVGFRCCGAGSADGG